MHKFEFESTSEFSLEQLYNLVKDVGSYPDFLPWCTACKIISQSNDELIADLIITFKGFSESYRSKVTFAISNDSAYVKAEAIQGPFKHLITNWQFIALETGVKVIFSLDFAMKSFILNKIVKIFFEDVSLNIIQAFEKRAKDIYAAKTT